MRSRAHRRRPATPQSTIPNPLADIVGSLAETRAPTKWSVGSGWVAVHALVFCIQQGLVELVFPIPTIAGTGCLKSSSSFLCDSESHPFFNRPPGRIRSPFCGRRCVGSALDLRNDRAHVCRTYTEGFAHRDQPWLGPDQRGNRLGVRVRNVECHGMGARAVVWPTQPDRDSRVGAVDWGDPTFRLLAILVAPFQPPRAIPVEIPRRPPFGR